MSGLAIVHRRDGGPVDDEVLDRMLAAAAHRGRCGVEKLRLHSIAIGLLRSRPEQRLAYDESQGIAAALIGRLDERTTLRERIHARGARLRDDTDVELVLRAYQAFGDDFAGVLSGAFVVAVWDVRRRALIAARDLGGTKPLHHWVEARAVFVASDLRQICGAPIPTRTNEGRVAEVLADVVSNDEETLIEGVSRLRAAHAMRIDGRSVRSWRFWSPADVAPVRHQSDAAYAEHFGDTFRRALVDTMRGPRPIGVDLSGGLDSSSIVCMARLLESQGSLAGPIETLSNVYPNQPHDERGWSRQVVARWPGPHHEIVSEPRPASESEEQARLFRELPAPPNATTHAQHRYARERGLAVRIAGSGGDELLDPLWPVTAAIASLRAGRLRELHQWSLPTLRDAAVRLPLLLLPHGAARRLRDAWRPVEDPPPWIDAGLARRVDLHERMQRARGHVVGFADEERAANVTTPSRLVGVEHEERLAASFGIELRHPFLHRALVELVLGMPTDQLRRPHATKVVLRNGMIGILPEEVRRRPGKTAFNQLVADELARHRDRPWVDLPVLARGWVDVSRLRATVGEGALDPHRLPRAILRGIWMLYALDKWFRATVEGGDR